MTKKNRRGDKESTSIDKNRDEQEKKLLKDILKKLKKALKIFIKSAMNDGENEETIKRRLNRMANGEEDVPTSGQGTTCQAEKIIGLLGNPNDNNNTEKHTVFKKLNSLFDNFDTQKYVKQISDVNQCIFELNNKVDEIRNIIAEHNEQVNGAVIAEAVNRAVEKAKEAVEADKDAREKAVEEAVNQTTEKAKKAAKEAAEEAEMAKEKAVEEAVNQTTEKAKKAAKEAAEEAEMAKEKAVEEAVNQATEKAKKAAKEAAEEAEMAKEKAVEEAVNQATEKAKKAAKEAVEEAEMAKEKAVEEAVNQAAEKAKEAAEEAAEEAKAAKEKAVEEAVCVANKEAEIARRETVGNLQKNLDTLKGELEAKKAVLASINAVFLLYEPVREKLQSCQTFAEVLTEKGLTGSDSTTLFGLARAIGETTDFAERLHSVAVAQKKDSKEAMTNAEASVYQALNECYRSIWDIDFDIFICPGNQSVISSYQCTDFNKNDMVNLLDPRDKISKYAQKVYVPLLQSRTGNRIYPAQVKAGNART